MRALVFILFYLENMQSSFYLLRQHWCVTTKSANYVIPKKVLQILGKKPFKMKKIILENT